MDFISNLSIKSKMLFVLVLMILLLLPIWSYAQKKSNENLFSMYSGKRKLRELCCLEDKKIILFTFDDGPDNVTTVELLDELKKRDAKVTFFVMGEKLKKYPEIVKRAYQEGHTIANHTYSHKILSRLKEQRMFEEIDKTNDLLNDLGINNEFLRPPYGITNKRVRETNMTYIYWDIDPMDWKYRNAEKIYNRIISKAKNGSIVLVHDVYKASVEGALMAIDKLLEEGYEIISVEEAVELGYIETGKNKEYYGLLKD